MLAIPSGQGKQALDRFYQRLCSTRLKVNLSALCANQGANTGNRDTQSFPFKLLGDGAIAHCTTTLRTG